MSAWPTRRLEDLATIRAGGTPPRGRADSYGGSIPWAKIADLTTSDGRLTQTEELITPSAASTFRIPVFPRGTVLLAMYGSIGVSAIADVATASNQAIVGIECGPTLSPEYLFAYLRHVRTYLADLGRGGTQANINAGHVRQLMIPLPPVEEQRRIASRLGDELRAVVDFGPSIERRASTLAALRRSALTTTFEQLLGERRSVGKLADVIKLRNDIVHPRDRPTGTAAFVGLEHIEAGSGRRIGQVPIDLAAMTGRKATFSPGNIVYGYLRPYLNKVWLADMDGFCSVDQYVLEVDARRADSDFVALFMLSDSYLSRAPITTTPGQLPRIRSGEVLSVPAPIPSLADQRRIATRLREQLAEIDRAKAALEAQRKAVNALPAALLREVFGPDQSLERP